LSDADQGFKRAETAGWQNKLQAAIPKLMTENSVAVCSAGAAKNA